MEKDISTEVIDELFENYYKEKDEILKEKIREYFGYDITLEELQSFDFEVRIKEGDELYSINKTNIVMFKKPKLKFKNHTAYIECEYL